MSKTYNNAIYLTDEPNDMYGKVMSIKDELILPYFEECTDLAANEIKAIEQSLKKGDNPKIHKAKLAQEIVKMYRGKSAAFKAAGEFERVHKSRGLPSEIPTLNIREKVLNLDEVMVRAGLASSKSEAKRLAEQGGVRVGGKVVSDSRELVYIKAGVVIQVGPRKFVRLG
jgi:tyrosyl-tRNA synthetase